MQPESEIVKIKNLVQKKKAVRHVSRLLKSI